MKVTDVSSGKVSVFNDNLSSHFFTDCIVPERIAKLFVYSQPSNTTLSQFCQRAVISKKYFLEEEKENERRKKSKEEKKKKDVVVSRDNSRAFAGVVVSRDNSRAFAGVVVSREVVLSVIEGEVVCACVYHNLTGTSCGGIAIIEHIAIDTSH